MKTKNIIKIILPVSVFLLSSIYFSCSNPTEPPPPVKPVKDPRTYTWTVDTLSYPGSYQTSMRNIWGSSYNNIYVVGHCETIRGQLWHFDGKQWKDMYTPFGISYDARDLIGFSSNDIWSVGTWSLDNPNPPPNFIDSTFIMHYDGVSWNYVKVTGGRAIYTVWGSSGNDIWAAGNKGTLFHYNGMSWTKSIMDTNYVFFDMTGMSSNEVYLLADKYDKDDYYDFGDRVTLKYDGNSWKQFDSVYVLSDQFYRVCNIGNNLYNLGYGVWKYQGGDWQNELTTDAPLQGYFAVSETNIIVVGLNSLVYHYNGKDWQQLNLTKEQLWFTGVWATKNEIFIIGSDYGGFKTYVFHGK